MHNHYMALANEQGRVQGHVQKINCKIKTDAILMPIISNGLNLLNSLNHNAMH
jgi:hypothetical protein